MGCRVFKERDTKLDRLFSKINILKELLYFEFDIVPSRQKLGIILENAAFQSYQKMPFIKKL